MTSSFLLKNRGSVLIMFLWVLILFTLFSLSVAFRARLATKIQAYETKSFNRELDSFTAMNLARFFLEQDDEPSVDSPLDTWHGTPREFKEMKFSEMFDLTIIDEESKLNINRASPEILVSVLKVLVEKGIRFDSHPEELASRILAWRGGNAELGKSLLGEDHKGGPFESLDELLMVPKMSPKDVQALKPFITVYGPESGESILINLNTVHPYVLEGVIRSLKGDNSLKRSLFMKVEKLREEGKRKNKTLTKQEIPIMFYPSDMNPSAFAQKLGLGDLFDNLLNQLLFHATVNSQTFMVQVRELPSKQASEKRGQVLRPVPFFETQETDKLILEAVLGPLSHRASVAVKKDAVSLTQLPFTLIPNLEVLSWHEGF